MLYKNIAALAALAATATAQNSSTPSLTQLLGSTPQLSNLTQFVTLIPGLADSLGSAQDITILAPSNEAFTTFLNESGSAISINDTTIIRALLSYHVLNGTFYASNITETAAFAPTLLTDTAFTNVTGGQVVQAQTVGDKVYIFSGLGANSSVTTANQNFTGGTVHIIDRVLTLPLNVSSTAVAAGLSAAVGALNASDLIETADTLPDTTFFIPNNEAFAAIGSALPNISQEMLSSLLQYHVVNGSVFYSTDLADTPSLRTAAGPNLTITIEGENVFVNGAEVVIPDVLVANGVVHVIDNVLNPSATAGPSPSATAGTPAFSGASAVTSLALTDGVPAASTTLAGGAASASAVVSSSAAASSSSGIAAPMQTGAIGAAALFAAGNAWWNI